MSYDLKAFYDSVDELTTRDRCLSVMYGRVPDNLGGGLVAVGVDASGNLQLGTDITLNVSEITPVNVVQSNPALLNATVTITQVGSLPLLLGQTTMANSLPVVIASDQTPVPVTLSGASTVTVVQATATNLNATVSGTVVADIGTTGGLALDTSLQSILTDLNKFTFTSTRLLVDGSGVTQPVSGTFFQATQPVSGTITANAGTGNFTVVQPTGTNLHTVVDNFPATQPVSGTVAVSNFPATQPVSGTVTANQGGAWNITNITGTVSLPTGASTAANQATANASLATIATNTPALGQTTMANSSPVVIASNQSSIPVTITGDTFDVVANIAEWGGVATSLGQTTMSASVPVTLASNQSALAVTGTFFQATQPVSGTITANAGTGNFTVVQPTGTNLHTVVDNFPATQPVSGTVTANAGTGNFTVVQGSGANLHVDVDNFPATQPVSGTVTANAGTGSFTVAQATGTNLHTVVDNFPATQPVSGTVAVTQSTSPWVVSGAVTATVSGTITANQGGAPWSQNLTQVGGSAIALGQTTMAASMPVVIASNQTAIPVSISADAIVLTENIAQWGGVNTSLGQKVMASSVPVTLSSDQSALAVTGTFFQATQPVSGTVTANQGTSPWVVSGTVTSNIGTTGGLALDTSINGILLAQGSTTAGELGPLIQGAVTTAAPTYTTGKTDPLSLTTAGALRVDGSGSTQPVSGTVAATQSGTWTVQPGNTANSTAWLVTGAGGTFPVTGTFFQATQPVSGTVTANQGTSPWVSNISQWGGAATTLGQKVMASSVPVTIASDQSALAVTGTFFQATQPVSGTVTANAGTGNFTVVQPTGTNLHVVLDSGTTVVTQPTAANLNATVVGSGNFTVVQPTGSNLHVDVDNFPATQPVSGTVAVTQSTSPWVVSGTVTSNIGTTNGLALDATVSALQVAQASTTAGEKGTLTMGAVTTADPAYTTAQTDPLSLTTTGHLRVIDTSTVAQAATTAGQSGTFIQGAVTTAAPAYTTGQIDPLSLTTAGALRVDGSGATQPVSGTVTVVQPTGTNLHTVIDSGTTVVTQPTAANLNATVVGSGNFTVVQPTGTNLHTVVDSGTVTANIGTTNGLALDATVAKLTLAQASATAGETGPLIQGAVTTADPAYTTGQTDPLSLTTAGHLRVIDTSTVAQASTTAGQSGTFIQGAVTTAAPAYTTGQTDPLSLTTAGALRVDGSAVTQPVSGTITANQGTANTVTNAWPIEVTNGVSTAAVKAASTAAVATDPSFVVALSPNTPLPTGANTIGTVVATQTTASNLNAQVVGNVAAGTADSGNGVKVSGIYRTTVPTLTGAQRGDLQLDVRSYLIVTPADGNKATYSASVLGLAPALLATDIFTITGSATATIRIVKVSVSATATGGQNNQLLLIKRSTANTAGTSTTSTNVPYDSNDAAGTATVKAYTANPTLGTAVGTLFSREIPLPPTGTQLAVDPTIFEINVPSKAIVLRGTGEVLAINLNGVTVAGGSFDCDVQWTEE